MKFCLPLIAILMPAALAAQEVDWAEIMKEAEWDSRPGDLIFRNAMSEMDELVRQAEGGDWSSVGILRAASGDPRVVYVDGEEGVTEAMLYDYVAGLAPDEYAVYRIDELDVNTSGQQMTMGPVASYALFNAYGADHEWPGMFGNGAYYNAELPFEAAQSFGVTLGRPVRLSALVKTSPELREGLLERWKDYRLCRYSDTADECWEVMGQIAVITPSALISAPEMRRVYPE